VARHYGKLLDGFVLDREDRLLASEIQTLGTTPLLTNTIMKTNDDKVALAREVLDFAARLT
jgi:LPPG:FO 2-phospho-L-lactate transferase